MPESDGSPFPVPPSSTPASVGLLPELHGPVSARQALTVAPPIAGAEWQRNFASQSALLPQVTTQAPPAGSCTHFSGSVQS